MLAELVIIHSRSPVHAPGRRLLRLLAPGSRWWYLLASVPLLTDLAETGRLPRSQREWISE